MKLWIGIIFFVLGSVAGVVGFTLNGSTPVQVGPVPVIGGGALALVGLILFLSAL